MKYTILQPGDIIPISASAASYAREIAHGKPSLILGLQCEFTHNEILLACGYPVFIPDPALMSLWDRELNGQKQDDKVATFMSGTLSSKHYVSGDEFILWTRLRQEGVDTIIHSFEYTGSDHTEVLYRGAISFSLWAPFQKTGKSSYELIRSEAYKYNLLQG